jgi:hypothetical protein
LRRPRQDRRGTRTTSGVTGPTANSLLPFGSTRPAGVSPASARLSQPLSLAPGLGNPDHLLQVAIGV